MIRGAANTVFEERSPESVKYRAETFCATQGIGRPHLDSGKKEDDPPLELAVLSNTLQ
ncbi:MAG: hypothetical protein ABR548_05885 [Actinomycetota bacterium]|nr:hypothetical protein [Actinomycetota bacterium]